MDTEIQAEVNRLNAIKDRIRTNLVAQGITVPEDTMLEAMAEQILSVAGEDGQRGTGLLSVTTAPSSYTTAVGGITPKYRMAISTIKTQAGVSEVLLGDTVRYSYYQYPIDYLDASYAYCTTRISVRGANGTSVTVESVSESTADGGSNVVTFSDGKTLTVKNGKNGTNGTTPVKGTDYFTASEKTEMVNDMIALLPKYNGGVS